MANAFAPHEPEGPASAGSEPLAPPAGVPVNDPAAPTAPDMQLLRAMADLDNLRKRFDREVARERDAERMLVAREWLPIVDALDRALEHVRDDDAEGLAVGVRVVRDQALDVLARLGYPRFGEAGERFDPARHEAVGVVAADVPPGTIVTVARPGYGTPEVTLRPAAVLVAGS
jgi:molecular chaperone GrpE